MMKLSPTTSSNGPLRNALAFLGLVRKKRLTPCLAIALCSASIFWTGAAEGATFAFVNEVSPFDNAEADGMTSETIDGITLTSLTSSAPQYLNTSGTIWTWDGSTVNDPNPRTTIGSNGIAVDNRAYNFFQESAGFNPGESWTVVFDVPVTFTEFNFNAFDDGDLLRVEVHTMTPTVFNFGNSDLDGSDDIANPLGMLVIPANTNITFSNPATPIASMDSSGSSSQQPIWRWNSLSVVKVPEPSSAMLLSVALLGIGVAGRRRGK